MKGGKSFPTNTVYLTPSPFDSVKNEKEEVKHEFKEEWGSCQS